MAVTMNSCRTWQHILNDRQPKICLKSCFLPANGQCTDYKVKKVVTRDPSVVKNFLEPESPVRRLIDIKAECNKCSKFAIPDKCCTLQEVEAKHHPYNLCSSKCRPLSTNLHSKEYHRRAPPKPESKLSFSFQDGTMVGRVFPMKFRIRRQFSECTDCEKDLQVRENLTDTNNMILLSDCCNADIYTEQQMDNWHIVPVGMITGNRRFTKKVLSEICPDKPKPVEPAPVKAVTISEPPKTPKKPKKKKKKKKGAKGKKGKK